MKKLKCSQLGGPDSCDVGFSGETFEEVAKKSKEHGTEIFKSGDQKHLKAMEEMKNKMNDSNAMQEWMVSKKKLFEESKEL